MQHERQLSAELSHELRTPLARITAETDWLTARPRTPAEQHTAHEAIASAAAEMRRICETLLTDALAAAAQAGRPVPRGVTCWTSRGLWHAAPAWNTRLPRPSPSAAPPWRRGSPRPSSSPDPPLLDNAHRYATRTIRVECVRRADGVEVCVDDNGPGVPPAVANRSSKRVGAPTPATTTRAPGSACRGPGAWPARRHHTGRCPGPLGGARFMVTLPAG
ncbi:histidine kinase dimerization/phospho-acceptor domain-containing protein [Streptomyces sp. NPDC018352]|uniref:histidine kinase dimerization/phospho-acceptor domain-containing protein n=1 Tax=Streptomyces sp. NPDC018352 TaxID=3157194 RepID=UPI0033F93977